MKIVLLKEIFLRVIFNIFIVYYNYKKKIYLESGGGILLIYNQNFELTIKNSSISYNVQRLLDYEGGGGICVIDCLDTKLIFD